MIFFKTYHEELHHERYYDILHVTQWSKHVLTNLAKNHKDWKQTYQHFCNAAKRYNAPCVRHVVGTAGNMGSRHHFVLLWRIPFRSMVEDRRTAVRMQNRWLARGTRSAGRTMILTAMCVLCGRHAAQREHPATARSSWHARRHTQSQIPRRVPDPCSTIFKRTARTEAKQDEGYLQDSRRPRNRHQQKYAMELFHRRSMYERVNHPCKD